MVATAVADWGLATAAVTGRAAKARAAVAARAPAKGHLGVAKGVTVDVVVEATREVG